MKWFLALALIPLAAVISFFLLSWAGVMTLLFLVILEVSLSFDNAIVNAKVLGTLSPRWQKIFLFWGLIFAVLIVRLIVPVVVVSISTEISPWAALALAFKNPEAYAHAIESSKTSIYAFGGTFLGLTSLSFFFDRQKRIHWFLWIEPLLSRFAGLKLKGTPVILWFVVLLGLYAFSLSVPEGYHLSYLYGSLAGVVLFLALHYFVALSKKNHESKSEFSGLPQFIYLEMLDASFSFDGVFGAFALSKNLLIITMGLGIGALFVRMFTVAMTKNRMVDSLKYLEHGAFWGILGLSFVMLWEIHQEVPEYVSGLLCVVLIGLAYFHSRWIANRRKKARLGRQEKLSRNKPPGE